MIKFTVITVDAHRNYDTGMSKMISTDLVLCDV